MTNSSSQVLASSDGPFAQIRTGTIATASLGTATVVVGGTSFQASYVVPFGVTPSAATLPQSGDLVSVVRQDASWQIIGRIAGAGPSLIENGSFEETPTGSFPEPWTLYDIVSASQAIVVDGPTVDGNQAVQINADTAATAQSYLYSSPAAVDAGDVVSLSVYVGAVFGPETPVPVDADLYALWFANDTDLYPVTSSADSLIESTTDVPEAPPFTPLSGSVVAPVTGFVRLALRSTVAGATGLLWDFATLRRNEA